MTSCIKRSVLDAGDRAQRIKQAADNVASVASNMAQRVLPHAGKGNQLDRSPWNNPIMHGPSRGANPVADAMQQIAKAVDAFAREVGDTLQQQAQDARDAAVANATGVISGSIAIRVVYQPYTEPMEIPAVDGMSIAAISCARCVVTQAPDTFLQTGAAVDWQPSGSAISVRSIDGLTPGDPRVLTYTFVYFGV